MRTRLIAIDVDGTLARSDGSISPASIRAVERAHDAGAVVVLATGRPWFLAARTANEVRHVDRIVCSNGAVVGRWPDGAFERDVYLDDGTGDPLAAALVERLRFALPGVGVAFEYERGATAEQGFAERVPPGNPMGEPVADVLALPRRPTRKLLAWHDDYDERLHHLVARLQHAIGSAAVVETSGLPFVEISPPGLGKASALDEVCRRLRIDAGEVVAFGDERNDVGMLRWAGLGVAMASGAPDAIAAADRVAPSNDDDGVATVLTELLDDALR